MRAATTENFRLLVTAALFTVIVIVAGANPAAAHDSEDGIVAVIDDQRVIVTAAVAFEQLGYLDSSGDGVLDREELATQHDALSASLVDIAREHVNLIVDGEPTEIIGAGVPALADDGTESDGSAYVALVLASGPHDGDVSDFAMRWEFDSPSTKVVLSNAGEAITGDLGDESTVTFSLSTWSSVRSFFDLGIEHIQFGPDHLLFLLVLTLAAVGTTIDGATTWRTVKLVTAFTIGHAVSLALAYFEVISVPASIVEPAISVSIVVAALLALRGRATDARPWLAWLVGVVHGLGFASNLSSLGVAASQRVAALAAFNLGVDVAQTAVVLLVIGVLWLGTQVLDERMAWMRVAGASGAAVFGIAWTASRLAELSA